MINYRFFFFRRIKSIDLICLDHLLSTCCVLFFCSRSKLWLIIVYIWNAVQIPTYLNLFVIHESECESFILIWRTALLLLWRRCVSDIFKWICVCVFFLQIYKPNRKFTKFSDFFFFFFSIRSTFHERF